MQEKASLLSTNLTWETTSIEANSGMLTEIVAKGVVGEWVASLGIRRY